MATPSPTDDNGAGRGAGGRFTKGNNFGKGNPLARKAQRLRSTLMAATTTSELRQIVKALVRAAVEGDVQAARLLLDRTLGPPIAWDIEDRIVRLEGLLEQMEQDG